MTALHVDFETRSELDLREVGLHRYARHPSTDVWCCALAKGEAEPAVWTPHSKACFVPDLDGITVYAHNAPFELEIWNQIMVPRYGWPPLKPEQTFCTMAMCYAMGLPGNLEDAALALGLPLLKDAEGRALMLRMARPRSAKGGVVTWWGEPEKLARLYAYCQQDVRVERELHKRLVPLSDTERRVWLLDYKINQQGAAVDVASVKGAIDVAEKVKQKGNEELAKVTGGAVQAVTAVAALKGWMEGQGVKVDSLAKQDVVDLLAAGGLPAPVERALFLRQEVGKASTAKLDALLNRVGADGRIRQVYQYHGAATGRWAGRAVQLHNLPRDMPPAEAVERILEHVRKGEHDAIDMIYGPPVTMISKCLRAFFVAPPGRRLISGDWSNVESRGAAWFAGEEWKLAAFRAQDAKTGPDVYRLGASRLLSIPVEQVTGEQRQAYGKVPDLAFQYQGGVGSGKMMGKTYGVHATDEEWDTRKEAWRAAHPKIVAVWKQIQRASINAVKNPGDVYTCGHPGRQAKFKMVGSFLWCLLPSGRAICYPYPRLLEGEFGPQLTYMTVPGPEDKKKGKIIYDPRNSNNWARISTYGGSLFNKIVQGFCRDFLALCMLSLDEKGASIVLHTHDEIAIEVDQAKVPAATKAMEAEMKSVSSWAAGLPLHAACEANGRYGL